MFETSFSLKSSPKTVFLSQSDAFLCHFWLLEFVFFFTTFSNIFVAAPGCTSYFSVYLLLFNHQHLHAWLHLANKIAIKTNIPLLTTGILRGMLMMPTRSIVGTRERKMARIRSASPLPALISCKAIQIWNIQLIISFRSFQWSLLLYIHNLDNMKVSLFMIKSI